jgi:hypothetical protein
VWTGQPSIVSNYIDRIQKLAPTDHVGKETRVVSETLLCW